MNSNKPISECVFAELNDEIIYGEHESFLGFPRVDATVEFSLRLTDELIDRAEQIRLNNGLPSLLDEADGYYNFYFALNTFSRTRVDNCIQFTVNGEYLPDDFEVYAIPLTEQEQRDIYKSLDKQFRAELGKSCEDLLAEAEKAIG